MQIRPITPDDTAPLARLVARIENFSPDEQAVARELIELAATPGHPDYRALVAATERGIAGYILFGPTPMTQGAYDLYWIATDPSFRGTGAGAALCRAMEAELREAGGRLVRVETSSTEAYGGTQKFYDATGYLEEARVRDFYKPGDDLIIYAKRL